MKRYLHVPGNCVIRIPTTFRTAPIVWFHGFYVAKRETLFKDLGGKEVKLLENLKTCPIKELIFIAPWLGYVEEAKEFVLDKDKQKIPLLDAKKNIIPGKFLMRNIGSPQYRGAEAKLGKAADDYLAKVLEGLAGFLVDKKQALTGTDGKPRSAFTIKNLILACHSGGGVGDFEKSPTDRFAESAQ